MADPTAYLMNLRDRALASLGRSDVADALRLFDSGITCRSSSLVVECQRLLANLSIAVDISPLTACGSAIIILSEHAHPIDTFILPLVSSPERRPNIVALDLFANAVGSGFSNRAICASSDGMSGLLRCRSLRASCCVLLNSLGALGRRANGFGESHALDKCIRHVRSGADLCIFPSGVLGAARWRSGLGVLLADFISSRSMYERDLKIAYARISGYETLSMRGSGKMNVEVLKVKAVRDFFCGTLGKKAHVDARHIASLVQEDYARTSDSSEMKI